MWAIFIRTIYRQYTLPKMNTDGHYSDAIINAIASQITSIAIVYSAIYSGAYQRKHQSSASLAFVRGIHRWPVNSPYKGPVTRQMSHVSFDDVIMVTDKMCWYNRHHSCRDMGAGKSVLVNPRHIKCRSKSLCEPSPVTSVTWQINDVTFIRSIASVIHTIKISACSILKNLDRWYFCAENI